jgi:hypothetical protein
VGRDVTPLVLGTLRGLERGAAARPLRPRELAILRPLAGWMLSDGMLRGVGLMGVVHARIARRADCLADLARAVAACIVSPARPEKLLGVLPRLAPHELDAFEDLLGEVMPGIGFVVEAERMRRLGMLIAAPQIVIDVRPDGTTGARCFCIVGAPPGPPS